MNIWKTCIWRNNEDICSNERRRGLRFRFENGIDSEVKRACIDFGHWLRREFHFPIRVIVYFKSSAYIKALDGDFVSAIFFEPFSRKDEPYIKIATGDYQKMIEEWGNDSALAAILGSITHELTHYFQWINNICLIDSGLEKQAAHYRKKIITEYAKTREHP